MNIAWRKTSFNPHKNKLRGHPVHFLALLTSWAHTRRPRPSRKLRKILDRWDTFFLRLSDTHSLLQALSGHSLPLAGSLTWEVHTQDAQSVLSGPAALCCNIVVSSGTQCLPLPLRAPVHLNNSGFGSWSLLVLSISTEITCIEDNYFGCSRGTTQIQGVTISKLRVGAENIKSMTGGAVQDLCCHSPVTWAQGGKVKVHATSLFSSRSSMVASVSTPPTLHSPQITQFYL